MIKIPTNKKYWYRRWGDDSAFSVTTVRSLARRDRMKMRAWPLQSIGHSAASSLCRIPLAWSCLLPFLMSKVHSWCPQDRVQTCWRAYKMLWPGTTYLQTKGLSLSYTLSPTPLRTTLILNCALCLPGCLHRLFPVWIVFLSPSTSV